MFHFDNVFSISEYLQQHENTVKSNNKSNNYINQFLRLLLLNHTHTHRHTHTHTHTHTQNNKKINNNDKKIQYQAPFLKKRNPYNTSDGGSDDSS